MKYIQYLLLVFILGSFYACNSTKKPKKEEVKESTIPAPITTIDSHLGSLTRDQALVKIELDTYLRKLSTFNTDDIVDMTYPKLFNVIDLDLFRQYIASMMNSTDIEMKSYDTHVSKLSKVTTFTNETKFAQAEYTSRVKIHFLSSHLYDTDEKMNFLYDALVYKYGIDNIKVNKQQRILDIKKEEKLLIIKEKDTTWKFLGDNIEYRQLYPSFLPYEIQKIIN
ncbi:MAG: Unknown protein [uncultured Sulfurovum sp.]|uniref:Lipoprotein n=1 Tax=uncultured Sulfurovum sp. TaxID=269237 RepID=A0A6S6SK90_9BACT|nr:MAG: Unknown protein [uncultured Sulfurovum sp.]